MNGHNQLIALRQKRIAPRCIFIADYPITNNLRWLENNHAPTIGVSGDVIDTCDFRFARGLDVHISGNDEGRCRSIMDACIQVQAKSVTWVVLTGSPYSKAPAIGGRWEMVNG